jgi:hypothetical protein
VPVAGCVSFADDAVPHAGSARVQAASAMPSAVDTIISRCT